MEIKIRKVRLVNAKQMSLMYPDRFSYWDEDIANIKVGDIVKVCNNKERFWVIIKEVNGDNLIGEVNSGLIATYMYNYGDLIKFKRENIYQVWDDSMNHQK